jgi:hypothetical protein
MAENPCPQCGATNAAQAKFCGSCGAALSPPAPKPPPPPPNAAGSGTQPAPPASSPKAVIALVLGIMSVFCCGPFTGVPAAILGKMEMDAIKQGRSPESNLGMAKAGFWIGIIGTALFILGIVLAIFFGLLSSIPYWHQ